MPVRFEFRLTKWPPNDLKWPIVTCCEVILRSFGVSELKSDNRNRVSVPKYLWKDIWHARKGDLAKKFCCDVSIGHLRSFGGHLVTRNSNMIGTIDSALKKPMKRHISCPKVRLGKKVIITGHYWSLEVIWRSIGDSKHKSYVCNRLRVPKNLQKDK